MSRPGRALGPALRRGWSVASSLGWTVVRAAARRMAQPGWWHLPLRTAAVVVLTAWTAGLIAAAVHLEAWEDELARTLLQVRADAIFRERMVQGREPIPREWYRIKTLALLQASERLQDDTHWALFVPGSWRAFDPLRQRVAARIERAFSDIAVETVRRELYFRASQLTGVPQDGQTAELLAAGDCATPSIAPAPLNAGGAVQELPEFTAVQTQLEAIEQLDRAVQAMVALQRPGGEDAQNLRLLARYTLGVELPGQLSRSVALFRTGLNPEDATFAVRGVPHIQRAVRCSLARAMYALDTRLFERNDLLAAEAFLAQRYARLFAPGGRPERFTEVAEGYREVVAALNEQEALLARAEYAWLHQKGPGKGPYDELLARIARVGLLGPEFVAQLRRQSGAAFERFRRQFRAAFGSGGDPALVWNEDQGRLVLSPQRAALRDGLTALLQEPFMVPPAGRHFPATVGAPLAWNTERLQSALALAQARRDFATNTLPRFPAAMRPAIAQFVDAHLAQLVQDAAVEAMSSPAPAAGFAAFRAQRVELAKVQGLLVDLGARGRADALKSLLAQDVQARLALADAAMSRTAIFSDRLRHFGWWQGEASPLPQALGAADRSSLRFAVSQQLGRLEEIGREAADYLAYADPSMANSPPVLRWQGILGELRRHRAAAPGSSLLALEHYLVSVAADVNRANCVERLALSAPAGGGTDEFAQLHAQIHAALLGRCIELRLPPPPADPARRAIPFG